MSDIQPEATAPENVEEAVADANEALAEAVPVIEQAVLSVEAAAKNLVLLVEAGHRAGSKVVDAAIAATHAAIAALNQ